MLKNKIDKKTLLENHFEKKWILLITLFYLTGIFILKPAQAASSCATVPIGAVSWWTGDHTAADFFGVNNGILKNGATYATGKVSETFSFNDSTSAYVAVPNSSSLNVGTGDFSMEGWIKTSSTKDVNTIQAKQTRPYYGAHGTGYHLYIPIGGIGLGLQMGDGTDTFNLVANKFIADGKFHHVATTVKRNAAEGARLFIDGKLMKVGNPTAITGSYDNTAELRIGGHSFDSWRSFSGNIDEFTLYKKALTDVEVKAIYDAGSFGKCKGTPFSAFIPRVSLKMGANSNDDSAKVSAKFNLGEDSDGIDPVTENVTVKLGNFAITIPAGKFEQYGSVYRFEGIINKVNLRAEIHTAKDHAKHGWHGDDDFDYLFKLRAKNTSLNGLSVVLPPSVQLTIGDDMGQTKLNVGEAKFGKGKDGEHWLQEDD